MKRVKDEWQRAWMGILLAMAVGGALWLLILWFFWVVSQTS